MAIRLENLLESLGHRGALANARHELVLRAEQDAMLDRLARRLVVARDREMAASSRSDAVA